MKKTVLSLLIVVALATSMSVMSQDNTSKECCKAKNEKCEKKDAESTEKKEKSCCADKKETASDKKESVCTEKEKVSCATQKETTAEEKSCGKKN
jgi:Ni/Co efflux regulator RcnB